LIVEFENPKNLGYGSYLSDIGEAFFTINQYDAKANVRSQEGTGHVVMIRNDGVNEDVVWRGILAEHDANESDVIFYCYGYEHFLFSLHSNWNEKWKSVKVAGSGGRPVNDLWIRAKNINQSPVQWMTSGTFEAPWTTSSQTTELVLNKYRANWKPILSTMKEMVAISTSDTSNIVYFEIDYPKDPTDLSATFNFWRDNTEDATDIRLEYPGVVLDWSDRFAPVMMKNKTLGVGTGPRRQLYRFAKSVGDGTYGRIAFGARFQTLYLSWVRDRAELKRVVKRRTRLGLREDVDAWVRCYPDTITPWRATASSHELGDRIWVGINHGVTAINKWMLMIGEQVVFVNGREYVQPMIEDRAGTGDDAAGFDGAVWRGANANSIPWELDDDPGGYTGHSVDDVTLKGVSGSNQAGIGAGGVFDKRVGIFSWHGANVPAGETVTLGVINDFIDVGSVVGYGLVILGADIPTPTAIDADAVAFASGDAELTLDSGALDAVGVMVTVHDGTMSPKAGSTSLIDDHLLGEYRMSVNYETTPAAGSRAMGLDGNQAHAIAGVLSTNSS
jgi:hypothetical protein